MDALSGFELLSTMHALGDSVLACPFFLPTEILEGGAWPHSSRLPLGNGWKGVCQSPGHEGVTPSEAELHECNLGYAGCGRVPQERSADAVRFGVARDRGTEVVLTYVLERGHTPVAHGVLSCAVRGDSWTAVHPEPRIQKMAECFLQSYLRRQAPRTIAASTSV